MLATNEDTAGELLLKFGSSLRVSPNLVRFSRFLPEPPDDEAEEEEDEDDDEPADADDE